MFNKAHWIVQGVMVLLAIMFMIGLYIIIYKTMYLRRASSESDRFHDSFWRSRDIEQIYKQAQALRNSPLSQMFVAGYTELAKLASDENLRDDREGNLSNIERALRRAQTVETMKLESMVPFLATTGSAAPFRNVTLRCRHSSCTTGIRSFHTFCRSANVPGLTMKSYSSCRWLP